MALLFKSDTDRAQLWREAFARLAPDLDFREWPEVGDPRDIKFALVWHPIKGDLKRYPNLKVIFSLGAGIEHIFSDPELPKHVPVVRMVDHGLTKGMTEYVLLHVLRFHRRVPEMEAQQRAGVWTFLDYPPAWERRVGVMGLGVLGGDAARTLATFEFQTAGWSRRPKQIDGVDCFHGEEGLAPFLARTEILANLLPLTPGTQNILNRETFARLPRGAFLINAARGRHLVEEDLLEALDSGQLAGAALDVFREEPLPKGHPFWTHPKVWISPHVESVTQPSTAAKGVLDSIRRFKVGLPLEHVVDWAEGY
ncbi:MAG: glyoxylate/hydroxypyruvate reductase A [Rhodospirillales bacterium]|nr:glyoxylate/hydroxypyruvate reductase A [Rhodospirillales bacterium]